MQRIRRKHLRKKSKKCCLANKIVISAAGTLVFVDDVDDGHEDVDVDDGALRTKCSINISRRNKASCFPHSDKLSWQQSKIYVITSRHSQRLRKLSALILPFSFLYLSLHLLLATYRANRRMPLYKKSSPRWGSPTSIKHHA